MAEPFLGQIMIFAGNFAPNGWAMCNGQTMAISQYSALFAILGTTYGGNGTSTFLLPNLQGRSPIGMGSGAGLPTYVQGQVGGTTSVTLLATNLPAHNHGFSTAVSNAGADQTDPTGGVPAQANTSGGGRGYTATYGYTKTAPTGSGITQQTQFTGSSTPVSIQTPYIAVNYIIALQGIFPVRG